MARFFLNEHKASRAGRKEELATTKSDIEEKKQKSKVKKKTKKTISALIGNKKPVEGKMVAWDNEADGPVKSRESVVRHR